MRPLQWILDWATLAIQRHPHVLRTGLDAAEYLVPERFRARLPSTAAAVRETFARPEDYWLGYLNAPKMKVGPFLLGMDPDTRYADERGVLVAALAAAPQQAARYALYDAEVSARSLAQRLPRAGRTGRIELAASYAEPVFARALGHVFGVPARGEPCATFKHAYQREEREPLKLYIRTFGATIGSTHPAPFGLEQLAQTTEPHFRRHLEAALQGHRAGTIGALLPQISHGPNPRANETVLGRLLEEQPFQDGDAGIVRCVAGMLSASASFPKAFASVLHELLARPAQLESFLAAVSAGDEARVLAFVREALRFRPPFPLLVRHCPHASTLAATHGEFASGDQVAFFPAQAMFDRGFVRSPNEFDAKRPEETYVLFGGAPRECIGKDVILSLFYPLFAALVQHVPQIFDAQPGRLYYDGPVLDRYELKVPIRFAAQRRTALAASASQARATNAQQPSAPAQPLAACPYHRPEATPGQGSDSAATPVELLSKLPMPALHDLPTRHSQAPDPNQTPLPESAE
jgi:cytochrome P450